MIEFFPSRAIAMTIGPVAIHWYGLMYLLGFLVGMWLLPRLQRYRGLELTKKQQESLFIHIFLGVLLGGRLGYVLFYGLSFYLQHPLEIFAVWNGGMASHGGIIGSLLALWFFCKRHRISLLALGDIIVIPVALGLAFGRFGNFLNQELYGTVTTVPWAMHFDGVEGLRHPTQIYAMMKDLFIASIAYWHLQTTSWLKSGTKKIAGQTGALFLVSYAVLRFIVEHYREQPLGYFSVAGFPLSEGQLLTIPVFVAGVLLWLWIRKR